MPIKAELSPAFHPPERRFFAREVLGIVEAVACLLIVLALVSAAYGEQWIGALGSGVVQLLTLLLGHYIAYVVPAMLAIDACNALLGSAAVLGKLRSWVRVAGGMLLIAAACALLTLHLGGAGEKGREAGFSGGGLLGSFIILADGLDLPRLLGRTGSFITLYGLLAIGFVLFTSTLLRDFAKFLGKFLVRLLPTRWLPSLAAIFSPFIKLAQALRLDVVFRFITGSYRAVTEGIQFGRTSPQRVMTMTPIIEIRSADEFSSGQDDDEDTTSARRARRRVRDGSVASGASQRTTGESAPSLRIFPALPEREEEEDASGTEARASSQEELELFPAEYELPSLEMLADPPSTNYRMTDKEAEELSRKIEETLAQFKIDVEVIEVVQGPVVTRFALKITGKGVRVNKIQTLESDIALALKAQQVRILTPIPGQAAVGIEVPNKRTNPVFLKELMESEELKKSKAPLSFVLGKNISGEAVIVDLAQMPHVLIAGATGAGKSVCLNCIIASILFRNPPDRVKFVMIDPKRVELSIYQAIPHLLAPVVSEPRKAAAALAWTVEQMETRYKLLAELGVRNIDGYNSIVNDRKPNKKAFGRELKFMPQIVVVIDELADLMMVAKNEVEEYVIRLAQMARAVGIHLVVATQRPSVNVITGLIKANFPTRIAFRVSSKVDSRTILDMNGAQSLLGRGDMLYSPGGVKPFRIQGAFVSDTEVERLADAIRAQEKARYVREDFEAALTPAQRAKAQLMNSAMPMQPHISRDGDGGDEQSSNGDGDGGTLELGPMMPTRGRVNDAPVLPADMESLTDEDLYDVALRLVLESRKASVSYIQRRMKIGYARAGRVMDMMEDNGIVGPYQGSKPRDLLIDPTDYLRRLAEIARDDLSARA